MWTSWGAVNLLRSLAEAADHVDALAYGGSMIHAHQLMHSAPPRALRPGLPTGLTALDHVTGGLRPGAVWALTGDSGSGKSVLVTQLARHVAVHARQATALVAYRDPLRVTMERLLAGSGRVPLGRVLSDELGNDEAARVAAAREEIGTSGLWVSGAIEQKLTEASRAAVAPPGTRLLVLDDAQRLAIARTPHRLKAWAEANGASVVVTMPAEQLSEAHPTAPFGVRLLPPWRDEVDVVADLRWRDQDEFPAEVDLVVVRNRWGAARAVPLQFQGFYARFVERG